MDVCIYVYTHTHARARAHARTHTHTHRLKIQVLLRIMSVIFKPWGVSSYFICNVSAYVGKAVRDQ